MIFIERSDQYLEHHGILGMKWGVRRYQNKDGSLTNAGKERYLEKHISANGPLTSTDPSSLYGFKGSLEEEIARDILSDHLREVYNEQSELSKDLIDHYKHEYVSDLDVMLPKDLGRIDRKALLDNFAERRVNNIERDVKFTEKNKAYYKENKKRLLEEAKKNGSFDMEFLESNLDIDPRTGNLLKGKKLLDSYENFLDDLIENGRMTDKSYEHSAWPSYINTYIKK